MIQFIIRTCRDIDSGSDTSNYRLVMKKYQMGPMQLKYAKGEITEDEYRGYMTASGKYWAAD